jgi:hypothetical protein
MFCVSFNNLTGLAVLMESAPVELFHIMLTMDLKAWNWSWAHGGHGDACAIQNLCFDFWPLPSFNKRSWSLIIPPPGLRQTSLQTDTRSRSRQYITRAKDWVEWTLEKPSRVKNSVLPRHARQQIVYTAKNEVVAILINTGLNNVYSCQQCWTILSHPIQAQQYCSILLTSVNNVGRTTLFRILLNSRLIIFTRLG